MAARGRGLFFLYIYIKDFKNLLVRNHRTDFIIVWQKCSFGVPLPRLLKPSAFVEKKQQQQKKKKHGHQGAYLPYIYIWKIFKNLLVKSHWTRQIKVGRNVPLETLYQDCLTIIVRNQ